MWLNCLTPTVLKDKIVSYNHCLSGLDLRNEHHLYRSSPSLVYGGYTDHPSAVVDQICHGDIAYTEVVVDGAVENVSVSENPHLKGLLKPLALITPLTSNGRSVYFVNGVTNKQVVHLEQNECVVFLGDTPHGGTTYPKGNKIEMFPSYHMYFHSTKHPLNDELFLQYAIKEVVYNTPEFMPYLEAEQKVEGIAHMFDAMKLACHNALNMKVLENEATHNKDEDKKPVRELMDKFISDMKKISEGKFKNKK